MTIVVWDGRVMAADRQASSSTGVISRVLKVHKIEHATRGLLLVGAAGAFDDVTAAVEWLRSGARPEKLESVQMLVVDRKRKIWEVEEKLVFMPYLGRRAAVGSARMAAMAVLEMGGSAIRAVEVCSKITDSCGGGVDTVRFD